MLVYGVYSRDVMVSLRHLCHSDKGVSVSSWTYDGLKRLVFWTKSAVFFSCFKAKNLVGIWHLNESLSVSSDAFHILDLNIIYNVMVRSI